MKVSVSNKIIKERGKENTIIFQQKDLSIEEFFNMIIKGYAYTTIFKNKDFHIKEKTNANWRSTEFVSFDFDDEDNNMSLNDFLNTLSIRPTIGYCTHHHHKIKHDGEGPKARFRIIYALNREVTNENEYKSIYQAILNILGKNNDDKTAMEVERFFYGNTESEEVFFNGNNILNVDDLELKPFIIPIKENTTKGKITSISKELNQLIEDNDFTDLFVILTKERGNRIITESNVIYNNKGYADLDNEYIELQRVFEKGKPKIYKDGELRHRKLFQWLIIRKQIKPNITFEELFTNAIFDLQHFINNSDGKFTKSLLLNIALSAYNHPITITKEVNKKSFKIDKAYCQRNNVSARGMVGRVRRLKNDERIGEWYDINKSVKDNLEYAKENNIKVSQKTLYRFCERNNINTKGIKEEVEVKEEKNPVETNNISINFKSSSLIEIEDTIKTNYPTYEDFLINFEYIKSKYKEELEREKNNNISRWFELLKYYQSLELSA